MRLLHLIIREQTDTEMEVQATVKDLLITLKAHGIGDVNIEQIVDELNKVGYDVDPNTLSDTLEDLDLVTKIERGVVYMDTERGAESYQNQDEAEKEDDKINKQAMDYIKTSDKNKEQRQKKAAKTDIGEE